MQFCFICKAIGILFIIYITCIVQSFAAKKDEVNHVSGRSFVEFNPVIPLGFGLQVTVPLVFLIPRLGYFGYRKRDFGRSVDFNTVGQKQSSCMAEVTTFEDYLDLLHINTDSCQKRFVCEIAANPKKFWPLSEVLLKTLPMSNDYNKYAVNRNFSHLSTKRLQRAAEIGRHSSGKQCSLMFSECPFAPDSVLDMGLLGWWQLLSNIFNIHMFYPKN